MEGLDLAWLLATTDRLRGIPSEKYPFPHTIEDLKRSNDEFPLSLPQCLACSGSSGSD